MVKGMPLAAFCCYPGVESVMLPGKLNHWSVERPLTSRICMYIDVINILHMTITELVCSLHHILISRLSNEYTVATMLLSGPLDNYT